MPPAAETEEWAGITDNQYVKLMVLKALGTESGKGAPEDIVEAIHYAEANGAVICNLSFGSTEYDESVAQAIQNSNMPLCSSRRKWGPLRKWI